MSFDLEHHARGILTKMEARSSLRRFKKTENYRHLLRRTIADSQKMETLGTPAQKRRAKLDKRTAERELAELLSGETPSEFSGLLMLPDPLKGMD